MFADRTLYLAVNDGTFFAPDAYCFDEATGEITRNEGYEGVNALFLLPLDKGKADKEKAEAYLKQLEEELHGPAEYRKNGKKESRHEIPSLKTPVICQYMMSGVRSVLLQICFQAFYSHFTSYSSSLFVSSVLSSDPSPVLSSDSFSV